MPIDVSLLGKASLIMINRPEKANSLDQEHARLLANAIKEECTREDTSVIVITGAGDRFFSTGVDLGAVASVKTTDDAIALMGEGLGGVCKAISRCEKPVIAAINGHAIGIGFEMVLASDLAYAVRYAKLGSPAVKWGMVPPASPTIGPQTIGYKNAAYIVLTARLVSAEEAWRMGVLNGVVDNVDELYKVVEEIAEDISKNSKWAVTNALKLLRASRPHTLIEAGLRTLITSTARNETVERARGFVEKNK